jgi:hypothetical protein
MSNKRLGKKHYWLGSKRAGTNHCRCVIGNGIRRRYEEATGVEPKRRNIMRYLLWFYHNSSQKEWDDAVDKYYINTQHLLSAKHLLRQPATPSLLSLQVAERRYGGERCVLKGIEEYLLEGDNDGNNKM